MALPPHHHVRLDNPSGFFKINTGFGHVQPDRMKLVTRSSRETFAGDRANIVRRTGHAQCAFRDDPGIARAFCKSYQGVIWIRIDQNGSCRSLVHSPCYNDVRVCFDFEQWHGIVPLLRENVSAGFRVTEAAVCSHFKRNHIKRNHIKRNRIKRNRLAKGSPRGRVGRPIP